MITWRGWAARRAGKTGSGSRSSARLDPALPPAEPLNAVPPALQPPRLRIRDPGETGQIGSMLPARAWRILRRAPALPACRARRESPGEGLTAPAQRPGSCRLARRGDEECRRAAVTAASPLDEPIGFQAVDQAHRGRMRKRQHAREQLDRVTGAKADMHQRRDAAEAAALTVGEGLVEPVGDGEGDGTEKVSLTGLTGIHASCIYCRPRRRKKRRRAGQRISAHFRTLRAPAYG